MSKFRITMAFATLLSAIAVGSARAQHCAPIVESYLGLVAVKHSPDGIVFQAEYAKTGGRAKSKYQAYLIAYFERDRNQVPAEAPKPLLDTPAAIVLQTQLIQKDAQGRYPMEFKFEDDELAQKMIEHGKLTVDDQADYGGWGEYRDRIRTAIFIPFLEDEEYSTLKGLPADKHECNYPMQRALLFQELPYSFSIHFGIVQAIRREQGKHFIQINGDQPPGAKEKSR